MNEIFVFKNAFLIDGTGTDPLPDASVVIADGRVREVSDHKGPAIPGATVIDLRGRTLMPGLIDAHVHPGNVEWFLTQTAMLPPAVYVHKVTRTLETDLASGFTTLRDAGGLDEGFREAVGRGLIRGPRLYLSVTPLDRAEGGSDSEPAPRNSLGITSEVCDGPAEMREAVRRTLERGADQIKVFADGEVVSHSKTDTAQPGQAKFSVEELRAAVDASEANGAYVMAHTYGPEAIRNCLEAGVRTIEHGNLMDDETAQRMAKEGVFYVPTLTVYGLLIREGRGMLDDYTAEKLEMVGDRGLAALDSAYRAGVRIGSGSDIIGPMQHLKGRELVVKAQVMTPMEVIVSATRTNAEMMGISKNIGTLEPGKFADLIVLEGNPLEDLSIIEKGLEKVLLVMKGGEIVKRNLP